MDAVTNDPSWFKIPVTDFDRARTFSCSVYP